MGLAHDGHGFHNHTTMTSRQSSVTATIRQQLYQRLTLMLFTDSKSSLFQRSLSALYTKSTLVGQDVGALQSSCELSMITSYDLCSILFYANNLHILSYISRSLCCGEADLSMEMVVTMSLTLTKSGVDHVLLFQFSRIELCAVIQNLLK